MNGRREIDERAESRYVSTGQLPPQELVPALLSLAVKTTAGLFETSGDWLYDVGLVGKSGIGGGIVTVSPGKGGLGTFTPLLDDAGNSVKGQLASRFLSRRLGLDLFASAPEPSDRE